MKYEFDVDSIGQISDGSHTFDELYHHRTTLFSIICNTYKEKAWKSWLHEDGTMYKDYFIAGVTTAYGDYTYHCHKDYWSAFQVKVLENAPAYDGHLPEDLHRLVSLINTSDTFGFDTALKYLKAGMPVKRKTWGDDVAINLQSPDENRKMTAPYLYVESRFGRVPWKETMIELFAEDWILA